MSVQATGKIKKYQILMGSLIFLNLPLAYFALKIGFNPVSVLFIRVSINLLTFLTRIVYLKPKIGLPVMKYFQEVIIPVILVTLLSIPLPLFVNEYFSDWTGFITTAVVSVISVIASIILLGLKKNEKIFISKLVLSKISSLRNVDKGKNNPIIL
jgi:hypothetical protein